MKDPKTIVLRIAVFLLTILWVYTASSKLMDFNDFRVQLSRQALPHLLLVILLWTLPAVELLTALLLQFNRTELPGLFISFILMVLFTGYVTLVLIGFFGQIPCSCGGVIKAMGWKIHFYFNLFFLMLTITSHNYHLPKKEAAKLKEI